MKNGILTSILFTGGLAAGGITGERPNIILIMADDLGYGDVSCYPHLYDIETPNIDRLAKEGVRMTQAYSAAPVCSPTRAALLTGKFPQRAGVYGNYDGSNPGVGPFRNTFPVLLQRAGYRTAWFGKWHQGWDVSNHPLNNGFDVAFGYLGGMHDYFEAAVGDHYIGGPFAPHAFIFDGFSPVREMDYLTEELNRRAVRFIKENAGEPFFIYLAHSSPHTPIQAPDHALKKFVTPDGDPMEITRRAMIDVLDTGVGELLAALDAAGVRENTLVIFTSDNGAENQIYNGGLRGTKMSPWEGATRIPLIASWPETLPAGAVRDTICSTPDLSATFLNIAGVDCNVLNLDGVNLMPFWNGSQSGHAHDGLVWTIHINGPSGTAPAADNTDLLMVRLGDWKLSRDTKRKIDALYNLADDPAEKKDLSAEFPEKKAQLIAYAVEFFKICPPASGPVANFDTRRDGDHLMAEATRAHYEEVLKKKDGKQ